MATFKTFEQWQKDAAKAINDNYSHLEPNEYNTAAADFLVNTGTVFTAQFKETARYFDEDTHVRDIYTIVLKNSNHRYRFNFGQSLKDSDGGNTPPTPYDVLACLTKYEVYSFEDFCGDYGYDTDSRKAYKTYKKVLKDWKNVERLFSSEQMEILRDIN